MTHEADLIRDLKSIVNTLIEQIETMRGCHCKPCESCMRASAISVDAARQIMKEIGA